MRALRLCPLRRHASSRPTWRYPNLGILAHVDAGRTTLTERVLYEALRSAAPGCPTPMQIHEESLSTARVWLASPWSQAYPYVPWTSIPPVRSVGSRFWLAAPASSCSIEQKTPGRGSTRTVASLARVRRAERLSEAPGGCTVADRPSSSSMSVPVSSRSCMPRLNQGNRGENGRAGRRNRRVRDSLRTQRL